MSRVTMQMPETYPFSTEMDVRIEHINRGNHLGNDQLISFLNEARVRFLPEQISDPSLSGFAMLNADIAVIYKSEAHYGDTLKIEVAPEDFNKYGFDLFFRVTKKNDEREVAYAKMGLLLFDFENKKLKKVSTEFKLNILTLHK